MAAPDSPAEFSLSALRAGSARAVARAISEIEAGSDAALALLDALRGEVGRAHRVGVTGPPGAGKSTLVGALAEEILRRDAGETARKLAIVAVDPSSPFSGGALLGDRFRMDRVADHARVFIRSMAARAALGGLSEATDGACDILDAAGHDTIIVETAGVGQTEVEVAFACDTTVVVLTPEGGDWLQAMKAGLLESADLLVVNKADHPRADAFLADLEAGLDVRAALRPPILRTIATRGEGVGALVDALQTRRQRLAESGAGERRRRAHVEHRLRRLWMDLLLRRSHEPEADANVKAIAARVERGEWSLFHAARELAEHTRL